MGPTNKEFDYSKTLMAKGLACCLLLVHHLFLQEDFLWNTLFIPQGIVKKFAVISKVCVAIFIFLSGYGLSVSYSKYIQNDGKKISFTLNHLFKLLIDYWFVFLIFVPFGFAFKYITFNEVYNNNVGYLIIDFFGLARLFNTPTVNPTWWFMSVIIPLYILHPIFLQLFKKSKITLFSIILFLDFTPFLDYLPLNFNVLKGWFFVFTLGILFSEYKFFEKIKFNNLIYKIITCAILLITSVIVANKYGYPFHFMLAIVIIYIVYEFISRLKFSSTVLTFIGKHSGNIFYFHTFILSALFFSAKYCVLIFILLLVVSLLISILIEALKKVIRINKLKSILFVKRK